MPFIKLKKAVTVTRGGLFFYLYITLLYIFVR